MVTQQSITENERGALMVEAIALLGLMTMMSPMVVRQTAERTSEMEEVAIAGQMKEIKDAVNNYLTASYTTLTNSGAAEGTGSITPANLRPFLPANALNGDNFRGNKLVNGYDIRYKYECTETRNISTGAVTACLGNACAISTGTPCVRYRISSVILSNSGSDQIDDRRASRIASMIGADGGYIPTQGMLQSLNASTAAAEQKKILGTQGIWEGNTDTYGLAPGSGGKIAATTAFSAGTGGDFLYRRRVDSLPDANSMFTDLDMGGAQDCGGSSASVCNKINNAGGLEVVNGRILIRSRNNGATSANGEGGIGSGNSTANIALGLDQSYIHVINGGRGAGLDIGQNNGQISLVTNRSSNESGTNPSGNWDVRVNDISSFFGVSGNKIFMEQNSISPQRFWLAGVNENNIGAGISSANTQLNLTPSSANLNTNATTFLSLNNGNVKLSSDSTTYLSSNTQDMALNAARNMNMNMGNGQLNATTNFNVSAGTQFLATGGGSGQLQMNSAQTVLKSTDSSFLNLSSGGMTNLYGASEARIGTTNSFFITDGNKAAIQATTSQFDLQNTGMNVKIDNGRSNFALTQTDYTLRVNNNSARIFLNNSEYSVSLGSTDPHAGHPRISLSNSGVIIRGLGNDNTRLTFTGNGDWSQATLTSHTNGQLTLTSEAMSNTVDAPIAFHASSGRINASYFMPKAVVTTSNGTVVTPNVTVVRRLSMSVDGNTGAITNTETPVTSINAMVNVDVAQGTSDYAPYKTHGDSTDTSARNTRFRVDPAFVSMMNDIRLTSRGGARLSEALPNYILKGIYILSNSYVGGGWPCGAQNGGTIVSKCSFTMPYYSNEQLGIAGNDGGWEYHCSTSGHTHPILNQSGTTRTSCTEVINGVDENGHTTGHVTFNYNSAGGSPTLLGSSYSSCPDGNYCWAHPFMGVVPAPGRSVTVGGETLHAQDEGACPDGYQAVMTLTPSTFELGKVTHYNYKASISGAITRYNHGFQNHLDDTMRDRVGIMQAGTRLGVLTQSILSGDQVLGWGVAMGTVTSDPMDNSGNSYIWNVGGIPANSWSAVAHTYCYFNPARFTMPNMIWTNTGAQSMDNPSNYIE